VLKCHKPGIQRGICSSRIELYEVMNELGFFTRHNQVLRMLTLMPSSA
jgi:hypothetical protein